MYVCNWVSMPVLVMTFFFTFVARQSLYAIPLFLQLQSIKSCKNYRRKEAHCDQNSNMYNSVTSTDEVDVSVCMLSDVSITYKTIKIFFISKYLWASYEHVHSVSILYYSVLILIENQLNVYRLILFCGLLSWYFWARQTERGTRC